MPDIVIEPNRRFLLGIDPGEKQNGVGLISVPEGQGGAPKLLMGFRPYTDDLADILEKWQASGVQFEICIEQFKLYPDSMRQKNSTAASNRSKGQQWSEMKTSKSIGVLEFIIRRHKIPVHTCMATAHKGSITQTYMKRAGMWGNYVLRDATHIRDATSVALYFWRILGIFNNNQRVIDDFDMQYLQSDV